MSLVYLICRDKAVTATLVKSQGLLLFDVSYTADKVQTLTPDYSKKPVFTTDMLCQGYFHMFSSILAATKKHESSSSSLDE